MKIKDIAKLAKVSPSAVSMALNNRPGLSDDTRDHILSIAKENGYKPKNAKYAASKIIRYIACLKDGLIGTQYENTPFFLSIIDELGNACMSNNVVLTVSHIKEAISEQQLLEIEEAYPSAGIILLGTNLETYEVECVQRIQSNLVVIDRPFDMLSVNCVSANLTRIGIQAATYIAENGFKHIGYVKSKERVQNFLEYEASFISTLKQYNLELNEGDIFSVTDALHDSKDDFYELLPQLNQNIEVLFCETDCIALGVLHTLKANGYQVPEDIRVIGCDNISLAQQEGLTTFDINTHNMTALAVKLLNAMITDPSTPLQHILFDVELIKRHTC